MRNTTRSRRYNYTGANIVQIYSNPHIQALAILTHACGVVVSVAVVARSNSNQLESCMATKQLAKQKATWNLG